MGGLIKYIVEHTYKPFLVQYLSRTRTYSYKGISLEIPPQVFHPGFFYSTKLLFRYIRYKSFHKKSFLELGAGSGLISIYAAKKGADVTATDINPVAVKCLKKNALSNKVEFTIIHSNLFDEIPPELFDMIVINPPYYKKKPVTDADFAWNCGENGEYFQFLFRDIKNYMHSQSDVLMVLCDGCDLQMMQKLADQNGLRMQCLVTKKTIIEKNYIFKIEEAYGSSN